MSTIPVRAPRPSGSSTPAVPAKTFQLSDIVSKAKPQPKRIGMYAGGGFGKTSLGAFFPKPIFLMTRGETGLLPLIESGLIPETPHFPELQEWNDLRGAIDVLQREDHDYKTMVLDTANGAERLCHEFVCATQYNNDWGKQGFASFQQGYDSALAPWRLLLNDLDSLRGTRGMTIVFLMHARIKTFKNPVGADYDKYSPELNDKTWSLTKGWLDMNLFGNFEVAVKDQSGNVAASNKKGKAALSSARVLYTNPDNPAYEAKNRVGLPDEIYLGESAKEGFGNLVEAMKSVRKPGPVKEATNV